MVAKKLKEYLDSNNVKYSTVLHPESYTAQEVAASAHIPGKELVKTVMVKINGKMAMAVVPSSDKIDFELLKKAAGAEKVELASEREFENLFPGCDVGAMPPFGNLYGMDVYAAEKLSEDKEIAFNAGSHSELIKLAYSDFEKLVMPKKARFSH
jgi:Ala-tRNA(Pro) deacylase